MEDLIRRIEEAARPDRGLDAEIAVALQLIPQFDPSVYRLPLEYHTADRSGWAYVFVVLPDNTKRPTHAREVPRYTASLDAALTLVPDGWDVRDADSNGGFWYFRLGRGDDNHPAYREVWSWPRTDPERCIFHRKPPALALCAAALKARNHDR